MQGIIEFLEFCWSIAGVPILYIGFPAILLNIVSHALEAPVYRALKAEYLSQELETAVEASSLSYHDFFVSLYRTHKRLYDIAVILLKSTSYLLAILLFYYLLGLGGILFALILLVVPIGCLIKCPRLSQRSSYHLANQFEEGVLEPPDP